MPHAAAQSESRISKTCFTGFSDAARENAASRVYIGYHFPFATTAGMNLGRQIGNFAIRHNLTPLESAGSGRLFRFGSGETPERSGKAPM